MSLAQTQPQLSAFLYRALSMRAPYLFRYSRLDTVPFASHTYPHINIGPDLTFTAITKYLKGIATSRAILDLGIAFDL